MAIRPWQGASGRFARRRSQAAAAILSPATAALLVEVEATCARRGCGPGCEVAVVARALAVEARELERDLAEERWDKPALRVL